MSDGNADSFGIVDRASAVVSDVQSQGTSSENQDVQNVADIDNSVIADVVNQSVVDNTTGVMINVDVHQAADQNMITQNPVSVPVNGSLPVLRPVRASIEDVAAYDSISQQGTQHSKHSNRDSLLAKEVATQAELVEKQKLLSQRQALEKRKFEMRLKREQEDFIFKQENERLELQEKLAVSSARSKVLKVKPPSVHTKIDDDVSFKLSPCDVLNLEKVDLCERISADPNVGEIPPENKIPPAPITPVSESPGVNLNTHANTNVNSSSSDIVVNPNDSGVQLQELVHSLRKPVVEIKKFGGDPTEYNRFVRQLNSVVLVHCSSYEDKLNALEMYTFGQPNQIVSSYSYSEAKIGFDTAMKELQDRYGNPYVMATAFIKKALDWEEIKANNALALDNFSIFLSECLHAVSHFHNLDTLNNSGNIQKLLSKIPFHLHDRWRGYIKKFQDKGQTIVFEHFVSFIKDEAKKLNDPIFGKEAISSLKPQSQPQAKGIKPATTKKNFSTTTSEATNEAKICQFCKSEHFIGDCKKLLSSPREKIMSVLSKERLCFGCLKFGHQKHKCWKKLKCSKCDLRHPTLLHFDDYNIKTEQSCHVCAHTEAGGFCTLPIIPVIVKNGLKTVKTYAFHDCGSSVCFCTESLLNKLGVSGNVKKICVETMSSSKYVNSVVAKNLQVFSLDYSGNVDIPVCYSVESIPANRQHVPTMKDIEMYPHLNDVMIPELNADVDLLIGNNIPDAFSPISYRKGPSGTPHASKTRLGWLLWNVIRNQGDNSETFHAGQILVNRISAEIEKTSELDRLLRNAYNFDFPERLIDDRKENSVLDNVFLEQVNDSVRMVNEHYEVKLPLKPNEATGMPKNFYSALNRLKSLRSKFTRDQNYKSDYVQFMNSMLNKNFAEEVPDKELLLDESKNVWYIPHHGVYHKQKKKIRVVFDCSARHEGIGLNDNLLSGPDLANSLIGVLLRFRLGSIAIMADIEGMFHQIKVPSSDRNLLRFLWWPDGDTSLEPKQYRMTAHIFGAVSSPSVANFVLQKTAIDNAHLFDSEVIKTVLDNFYVDDCLRSVDGESNAIELANNLIKLLKLGGFRLHKFISNSRAVLDSLPESECADISSRLLGDSDTFLERALGVNWEVSTDALTFQINVEDKPKTRRGILSVVSSVFDPLGLAAPALLPAKLILKDICNEGYSWDQTLDDSILQKWNMWIGDLPLLESVSLRRCVKALEQTDIISTQLHHFSDASETGYGVVSYMRLVDKLGHIKCTLIMGKARVAPLKRITIPRMELTAATLAVKLNNKIVDELKTPIDRVFFWTDSSTVLNYISNDTLRYQTFVANRVAVIRDATDISQWNFIPGKLNPADDASRGLTIKTFLKQKRWFEGPEYLQQPEADWPKFEHSKQIDDSDPNIKKSCATAVNENHPLEKLMCHYSSYSKLIRAVGYLKLVTRKLYRKCYPAKVPKDTSHTEKYLTVEELLDAELVLIKYEQSKYWCNYLNPKPDSTKGDLAKLDPVILDGVLRVGGRLNRSDLALDSKHQILIPKNSKLSELLIRKVHQNIGHLGKNSIISEIRKTYWIVGVAGLIKEMLSKCVSCRKYRATRLVQKMADLPPQRVIAFQPPFYHSGMDFFGPFELKRGRSLVKRYGVIFTCLNSRAVHLEMAYSLDTDSCLNAIRRFISRRGKPNSILSDNGTNILSAAKELKKGIKELDNSKIGANLSDKGIKWECNPPAASHFGGVWERLIRQVRKVLHSLEQINRLDDESFQTLLCEIESILNHRPITKLSETPDDLDALTPSHLLQIGARGDSSQCVSEKTDMFVKRRWRQVQYLSNIFWKRWLNEYVPSLQERQKWLKPRTNVKIGDIVLVVDSGIRNSWSLARVIEVQLDKKGFARVARIQTKTSTLLRPIHKLCLILEADEC